MAPWATLRKWLRPDLSQSHDRVCVERASGYGLVGGIGEHENTWLMAHVRGPAGIVVALTERIE